MPQPFSVPPSEHDIQSEEEPNGRRENVRTGKMKNLEIDVEGRTAWAETGLTAGEYTAAAAAHGLATGFGDTRAVGIGGITLGGGYLVRKHGLTIDDLLAADVVTADGELLRVDAERHPDLYWAIRGGGGNFGVATRFKFRLHRRSSRRSPT
jgi:FAD/FMN-containing dehydrogenase